MSTTTEAALIVAVESLKLRVSRLESLLTNFVGIYRDSEGVLQYSRQETPTPAPEPVPTPTPETEESA